VTPGNDPGKRMQYWRPPRFIPRRRRSGRNIFFDRPGINSRRLQYPVQAPADRARPRPRSTTPYRTNSLQREQDKNANPVNANPPAPRTERFAALALPHLDAAYNLARWLTRNDSDAQDVVQDAYLRAFRAFDGLRGDAMRPWLLAIVRNASLSWLAQRHRGRELSYDEDLHGDKDADGDAAAQALDPQVLLMRAQDKRRLDAAIDSLPLAFREVIVLRELQECSYEEIVRILGVPPGTVMSRLARGRARLLRLLATEAHGSTR
jgi:RNA polymerase sigma-70 factor (ECF subfamily)